ncbi:protein CHROMATIN REMODELING 24 [Malania oleifera]|uniref:protein CHROMATIN REMODELING 24 n=1 Tax=Malania oleifera TaxID=397392 RepID=UPI0025AE36C1|nr:protein CHROMATIN REMODELING 24 [Malania oleifera]
MADNENPLSLNQRHTRLLQDLPASHHRTTSNLPPTGQEKPTKLKLKGRRRLCKAFSSDTHASDDNGVPQFSGIADFDSPPDEQKREKVKIEGRRRLCKESSSDGNDDSGPKFSEIADFDSPPVVKKVNEGDGGGGNEIRDILNDLNSRLELLSIEKKIIPKRVNDLEGFGDEVIDRQENVDLPKQASATSSFSMKADQSNRLLDIASQLEIGSRLGTKVDGYDREDDLPSESEDDRFVMVNRVNIPSQGANTNESWRVDGKSETLRQSLVSNDGEEQEDGNSDDCVLLSCKGLDKKAERQGRKFKEDEADPNGVDALDGDYADDTVLEDPYSITLSSPKYTYNLPGKIAEMLYPHQRDGLKWLWSLHCQGKGGILGDDMGLGKTMQVCSFLAGLFHSCLIKRALVVAPKTLLSHWIKELSAVGLSEKTREYFGTCTKTRQYELQYILQDKGILLTTYDIVRNNSKSLRGDSYFKDERSEDSITWDYMILDEGHLIKNPSTQRAKSLLDIPSAHRIIISGTPIQNNLKELWALFSFCCPELLGDKHWFKERYEAAILRGNDKHASDRDKRIGSTVAKDLRERIQPYFLRRLKNEIFGEDDAAGTAKLSKKNEIIAWLKLTSCQRKLYEAFLKSELVLSAFDGSPLAALTILKKICDHPLLLTRRAAEDLLEGMESMLNQEDLGVAEKLAMYIADVTEGENFQEKHANVSCKISFILSLLDNLISEGHNVLIFSQTRKMLNLIEESLVSNGYEFLRIDGATKAGDRVKIVNDFQEGVGAPIFLLTSQVGGLGLTLTKADRVIVVDPAWNPSTDNQSVDRAYRIGQKKDVVVYRLMTCGTVEEKIYRKQIFKGGLFKTATEHKEQIRYFSQQDLRELFSLPSQGFDVSLTQQQLHKEHDSQYIMDGFLTAHIKFLETLGIAGVSHHSLLFSKAAAAPISREEEEEIRLRGIPFVRLPSSNSSSEHNNVDGAEHAFIPKDVKLHRKSPSRNSPGTVTESEIQSKISRMTQIFADKVIVSKLPDKGKRIQTQIVELTSELERIKLEKNSEKEVIDLDDVNGEV